MSFSDFLKTVRYPRRARLKKMFRAAETMSCEELDAFRLSRVQELVNRFYSVFEFYKKACDDIGVCPDDLKTLSDLSRFPVMDKAVLRANEETIASASKGAVRRSTSGSTGVNFRFYLDDSARGAHGAFLDYAEQRLGVRGGLTVGIWGGDLKKAEDNKFLEKIKLFLLGACLLPGYGMDEDTALSYLAFLQKKRPSFVYGYPSYLAFLARTGQKYAFDAPKGFVLVASGEQMTEQDREVIEAYFQTRVYNRYGSCEFSTIAHELPNVDGLYVNPLGFFLEVNERDELLVTDLWNFATPFIRYNIGDRAALDICDGRCVIRELYGRCNDVLFTPSGKMIPSQFWTILSRVCKEVLAFQVVMKSDTRLVMRVKSEQDFDAAPILENFNRNFGDEMTLTVTRDEPFEQTKMGKHKFVIRKEDQ